jgi:transposase
MAKKNILYSGVDISKNHFHVCGQGKNGKNVFSDKFTHMTLMAFYRTTPRHKVFIEACGMSYDWARKLTAMGHEVYLIPPGRIKAFLCGQNKTDANDAEAICMAGQNPTRSSFRSRPRSNSATITYCQERNARCDTDKDRESDTIVFC